MTCTKLKVTIGAIMVIGLLSSCTNNNVKKDDLANTNFTFNEIKINETTKELEIDVYSLNTNSNNVTPIVTLPYNSQYPLAVYDGKDNVYFTKKNDNTNGIYLLNVKNNAEKLVTQEFFAVNEIQIIDDKLIILGVLNESYSLAVNLFEYDLINNILKPLSMDSDFDIRGSYENWESKTKYVFGYSESILSERLANQTDVFEPTDTTVFEIDSNGMFKEVFVLKEKHIDNLIVDNNTLYFNDYFSQSSECVSMSGDECTPKSIYGANPQYSATNDLLISIIGNKIINTYDEEPDIIYEFTGEGLIRNLQAIR